MIRENPQYTKRIKEAIDYLEEHGLHEDWDFFIKMYRAEYWFYVHMRMSEKLENSSPIEFISRKLERMKK